jgi:GxxExxY protein
MPEPVDISDYTNEISKTILDSCFSIHTELGPGLLESVYEDCLYHYLIRQGVGVERQKSFQIKLKDFIVPTALKIDLLVDNSIIVELKAVEKLIPLHEAQLHTYLKLTGMPLGLLINFNTKSLRDGIKRIAMTRPQKNFA